MADAGTSLGAGNEEQKSQHGQLCETSMGLERISSASAPHCIRHHSSSFRPNSPSLLPLPFNTLASFTVSPLLLFMHTTSGWTCWIDLVVKPYELWSWHTTLISSLQRHFLGGHLELENILFFTYVFPFGPCTNSILDICFLIHHSRQQGFCRTGENRVHSSQSAASSADAFCFVSFFIYISDRDKQMVLLHLVPFFSWCFYLAFHILVMGTYIHSVV